MASRAVRHKFYHHHHHHKDKQRQRRRPSTMLLQTLVKLVGEHCYYSLLSAVRSSASTVSSTVSTSASSTGATTTTTTTPTLRILTRSWSPQKTSSSLSWIQTVSSALLLAMPVVVMDEARKTRRRLENDPSIGTAAHWSNPWMMANVGCKRSKLLQLRALPDPSAIAA